MGAAKYVGRVGGLAVALGVGVAVFTGHGVSSADTGDSGSAKTTTTTTNTTSNNDPGSSSDKSRVKVKKGPPAPGTAGRHRAIDASPTASTATSIPKGLTGTPHQGRSAAKQDTAESSTTAGSTAPSSSPRETGRRAKAVVTTSTDSVTSTDSAAADSAAADSAVVAGQFDAPAQSAAKEWLAGPRAKAGRAADVELPVSSPLTPAQTTVTHLLATAVDDVLSPFAGDRGPSAPLDPPADLLLLAGTRREVSTAALAIDPYTIGVQQGVIGGCVVTGCATTSDGLPLIYTVQGNPSNGGKVSVNPTTGAFTFLPFNPENSPAPSGQESFKVLVAQTTPFDTFVTGLPLVGMLFVPVITTLQQVPLVNMVLAPLIGSAFVQMVNADLDELVMNNGGNPIAYTTMVTSFDGTQISTNFFPAIGTPSGPMNTDPSILYGPGLATAGATDPTDPLLATFRNQGYNVVTWDPRGEFASGGVLQLDSPQFEGRDVSAIISWMAGQPGVEPTANSGIPNDPQVGMVGVSYGGGIQLVTAANDKRIDAISPAWAWNSLPGSLYPEDTFKTAYSALLLLGLVTSGANINNQLYGGILSGALLGILTPSQIALLAGSGPSITVSNITAPTLLLQGTVDVLFPLEQSILNAGYLTTPSGPTDPTAVTKVIWFCGGHGSCLQGQGNASADQAWTLSETVAWMNRYVKNDGTTDTQVFEWSDQNGTYWSSDTLPSDPAFYGSTVIPSAGTGTLLPIIPIIGGSGPQSQVPLPYSLGDGAPASNAVNIPLAAPTGTTNVVGAPTLTMAYSGFGTSRHVYAQIVDKTTGLVVGNIVTPVPVTLDGQQHQVQVSLNAIAYTMDSSSDLELQIVTSATPYLNLTEFGYINVGAVSLDLPTAANAVQEPTMAPANTQLVAV